MRGKEVVEILMRRDGLTRQEAADTAKEAYEAVLEAMMEGEDPEEVWMDYTGLEPDYLL